MPETFSALRYAERRLKTTQDRFSPLAYAKSQLGDPPPTPPRFPGLAISPSEDTGFLGGVLSAARGVEKRLRRPGARDWVSQDGGKKIPSILQHNPELYELRWERLGPISANEMWERSKWYEKGWIPFNIVPAMQVLDLYSAAKRLEADDYESEHVRQGDVEMVRAWMKRIAEEQVRGVSTGGGVVGVLEQMPGFVGEFIATGGLANLAKKGALNVGKKVLAKTTKGTIGRTAAKAATRVGAAAAGAGLRTLAMPHRVVESAAARMLPKELELTETGQMIVREAGDRPGIAFAKAFGDVLIENFSEVTGPTLNRTAKRILDTVSPGTRTQFTRFMNALRLGWLKKTGAARAAFIPRMLEKGGFHGILEEMGEEEVGRLLRATFGVEGDGNVFERLVQSIPSGQDYLVQLIAFSIPGATRAAFTGFANLRPGQRAQPEGAPRPVEPTEAPPVTPPPPGTAEPTKPTQDAARTPEQRAARQQSLVQPPLTELPKVNDDTGGGNVGDLLDFWFADKDEKVTEAEIDTRNFQQEIVDLVGGRTFGAKARKVDMAIQVYIDLKGKAAEQIDKWRSKLSAEQLEIVEMSQNLTAEQKALAERIIRKTRSSGVEGLDAGVLNNVLENYTMRLWETEKGERVSAKFRPRTARARQRTLESILHGWALGKTLRIKGATNAQEVSRTQISQAIIDRNLLLTAAKGDLISATRKPDWIQINHPNFTKWSWVGKAEEGKTYGRGIYIDPDGNIFQQTPLYATPELAKKLNKILGTSKLRGIPLIDWVTKWSAIIKHTILFTSFFHHQAFLRSYTLGSRGVNPKKGWEEGRQAIVNFTQEARDLVRGGFTIGKIQDWDEAALHEQTLVGEAIAKVPAAKEVREKLLALSAANTHFLFHKMGPYYKMQAGLLEYRRLLADNADNLETGQITRHELAKIAANLSNDDFGGLHLGRLGRDPTLQHIFQLFALAPDWTESNIRSMVKMFNAGQEGAVYRQFWGRILLKGLGSTIIFNLIMSGFDDKDFWERYKIAWETGRLRWLDVDITPIYRGLGGKDGKRKYFSLLGHFRDPIKFVVDPVRSAKHKGSVLTRFIFDAGTGSDWAGRPFTTLAEIFGMDQETSYRTIAGEPIKRPKPPGRLVTKVPISRGPVSWATALSFTAYEVRASAPIQVQQLIGWLTGEIDGFDAITKSLGLMTATTFPKETRRPSLEELGTKPKKSE